MTSNEALGFVFWFFSPTAIVFIKLSSPIFAEQLDGSVTIWKGSLHHSFPIREWLVRKTMVICLITPELSRSLANFYWVLLEKKLYTSMGMHRFIFYSAKASTLCHAVCPV